MVVQRSSIVSLKLGDMLWRKMLEIFRFDIDLVPLNLKKSIDALPPSICREKPLCIASNIMGGQIKACLICYGSAHSQERDEFYTGWDETNFL